MFLLYRSFWWSWLSSALLSPFQYSESDGYHSIEPREPFKNYLADFVRLGGGEYPPFSLSFFEHNDCPLRGEGEYPLNSAMENSAKKQVF